MAGNPVTPDTIDQAQFTQAQIIGDLYTRLKQMDAQWDVNVPDVTAMNGLGYANTTKQALLMQWKADIKTVIACIEGTQTAANIHNMVADIARLKGVS
jgi:hypothetical protein